MGPASVNLAIFVLYNYIRAKHFSKVNQLYYLKGRFAQPINTNRRARKNQRFSLVVA